MTYAQQREVWEDGNHLENWPCDMPEPNGSIEHHVVHNGQHYSVRTTWDEQTILAMRKTDN